jgi:hypothetical protein
MKKPGSGQLPGNSPALAIVRAPQTAGPQPPPPPDHSNVRGFRGMSRSDDDGGTGSVFSL